MSDAAPARPPFSNTVERAARDRTLNFILDIVEANMLGGLVEKDVTTPGLLLVSRGHLDV